MNKKHDKVKHMLFALNRLQNWLIERTLEYDEESDSLFLSVWFTKGEAYEKSRTLKVYHRIEKLKIELIQLLVEELNDE